MLYLLKTSDDLFYNDLPDPITVDDIMDGYVPYVSSSLEEAEDKLSKLSSDFFGYPYKIFCVDFDTNVDPLCIVIRNKVDEEKNQT